MELTMTLGRLSMPAPHHAPADTGPARKRPRGGARPIQDRAAACGEIASREIASHEIDIYLTSGFGSLSQRNSGAEIAAATSDEIGTELSGSWISSSANGAIAGNDIPAVDTQLAWDVRGVPPRGRPV